MTTDVKVEDAAWCATLFGSLIDGGVWGVPRSGLVFRRAGGELVLDERMPHDPEMPITPEQLREQQDSDFESIRRHFAAAGIEVTKGGNMTTETETTVQALAREAADCFEGATRPSGGSYRRVKVGSPQWVRELVRDAHGEFLPDDWRYDLIENALLFIADSGDPEDGRGEFADEQIDVYNGDRVKWLESSIYRGAYCDDAAEEFGGAQRGVYDMIGLGQYAEADEVYGLVLAFLESQVEDGVGS